MRVAQCEKELAGSQSSSAMVGAVHGQRDRICFPLMVMVNLRRGYGECIAGGWNAPCEVTLDGGIAVAVAAERESCSGAVRRLVGREDAHGNVSATPLDWVGICC